MYVPERRDEEVQNRPEIIIVFTIYGSWVLTYMCTQLLILF